MSSPFSKRVGSQCVSVSLAELLQLAGYAKQLKLSALRIKSSQTGQHLSRLLGKGMEFAESRHYQAGDDIRCIDWRITARSGKAHTKLFTEEKERQILLWIDMRSSMFFATKGVFKSVQAALTASCIAWNTSLTGNRLGGFVFDNQNQYEFRPNLGKRSVLPLLHRLSEYGMHSKTLPAQNPIKIMEEAILSIQRVAVPGSLIFLLSDFRHLSTHAKDILMQVARNNDLCLCFFYDPFEENLPKNGGYSVTDGKNEIKLDQNNPISLKKYHELFMERKKQIISLSHHQHIHFIELSTQDDCFEILKKNFR